MRPRGTTWTLIIVLLLLAGSVVGPVLADSPTIVDLESGMQPVEENSLRVVDDQVGRSSGAFTVIKPQLTETPSRPILLKFEGTVQARPATPLGDWQIDGHAVSVKGETSILPLGYDPRVGDRVVVKALRTSSQLTALKITVQKPGQLELYPVEFRGTIDMFAETPPYVGDWRVAGITVSVNSLTTIIGAPQAGLLAQVRGSVKVDGTVAANYIEVLDPSSAATQFQFRGRVQKMSSSRGTWVIGGVSGEVDRNTDICPGIQFGSLVEVNGDRFGLHTVFSRIALVQEPAQVYLEGLIQRAGLDAAGEWIIGDKPILVDESTFVDESHGPAQSGMWAQVTATDIDGVYWAQSIRIEQP